MQNSKPFHTSKTLIVNMAFVLVILLQVMSKYYVIDPELQGIIIALTNYCLRLVTDKPISFK